MKLSLVCIALGLVLLSCSKLTIAPPTLATPGPPRKIWSGSSGGFNIDWTTGDIAAAPAKHAGKPVLSELGRAVVDFHAIARKQTSDCDMVREAKLQSVVGAIVSIQNSDTMKCTNGANGTGLASVAIDLVHPKGPVLLSTLFPATELAAVKVKASHFCKAVPSDLFSRYAFSEIHGNTVIVAITLPPDCTQSELNVALNVPATLSGPLKLAAQRKQGFLWHDQGAISGGSVTTVNYHYRTSVE